MTTLSQTAAALRHGPRFLTRVLEMITVKRSRHALAQLDDHMLSDIGLTREQAVREADRAAWDVANHWRK